MKPGALLRRQRHSGAEHQPVVIHQARRVEIRPRRMRQITNRDLRAGAQPFVNLGMPVGEGETAGSVMVRGRKIIPRIDAGRVGIVDKITVVDRIRVFINRDEVIGWPGHGGELEPLAVSWAPLVLA